SGCEVRLFIGSAGDGQSGEKSYTRYSQPIAHNRHLSPLSPLTHSGVATHFSVFPGAVLAETGLLRHARRTPGMYATLIFSDWTRRGLVARSFRGRGALRRRAAEGNPRANPHCASVR